MKFHFSVNRPFKNPFHHNLFSHIDTPSSTRDNVLSVFFHLSFTGGAPPNGLFDFPFYSLCQVFRSPFPVTRTLSHLYLWLVIVPPALISWPTVIVIPLHRSTVIARRGEAGDCKRRLCKIQRKVFYVVIYPFFLAALYLSLLCCHGYQSKACFVSLCGQILFFFLLYSPKAPLCEMTQALA